MYYRGDYYRGDYYRGDPGLGSFFGGLARRAAGAVGGFLTGGVPGAIAGALGGGGRKPAPSGTMALVPQEETFVGVKAPFGFQLGYEQTRGAQVTGAIQAPMGQVAGTVCQIKGYRPNKSTYITRGGGTSRWPREVIVHPRGTECVKIRRMNVANPRALRRSIRRAAGFVKLASRTIRYVAPQKSRRFGGFKRRKKAA